MLLTRIFILLGALCGLIWLWGDLPSIKDLDYFNLVLLLLFSIAIVVTAFLMLCWKKWGLILSWGLSVLAFGFGTYWMLFSWAWNSNPRVFLESIIFKNPFIISIFLGSLVWLIYFTSPKIKRLFK